MGVCVCVVCVCVCVCTMQRHHAMAPPLVAFKASANSHLCDASAYVHMFLKVWGMGYSRCCGTWLWYGQLVSRGHGCRHWKTSSSEVSWAVNAEASMSKYNSAVPANCRHSHDCQVTLAWRCTVQHAKPQACKIESMEICICVNGVMLIFSVNPMILNTLRNYGQPGPAKRFLP